MSADESRESERCDAPARAVAWRGWWRRSGAAVVALAALGPLVVAVRLQPSPAGYGTHTQLGDGPCGMLVVTGLPCPTCGMTTAFAHAVRGRWLRAAYAQPAGFVLALAAGATAVLAGRGALTGRFPDLERWGLGPQRLFVALLVLLIAGWAFKLAAGILDGSLPARSVTIWSPPPAR
ncbi:MAG: hypothetical protein CHACPFDD_03640 [Phycisphaerae bacterium]|nr:hypothetical protein [Phycisphaerae bacterium]